MAEGSQVGEIVTYTKAIRTSSGYKNPWGDGDLPDLSFGTVTSFMLQRNRSDVPGEKVR